MRRNSCQKNGPFVSELANWAAIVVSSFLESPIDIIHCQKHAYYETGASLKVINWDCPTPGYRYPG